MATKTIKASKKLRVQKAGYVASKIVTYTFLTIMAFFIIIPFYWMINVSLQSNNMVLNDLTPSLYPREFSPQNYIKIFSYVSEKGSGNPMQFHNYLINTLIVAFFSTALGTIFSILVAFALSRLNFKGRELVFTILLATMMIPGEMMVISNYKTVANLGWTGTRGGAVGSFLSMIVPFLVSIFHIYLLRQNFKQIPDELYYAAKVDGTSDFKYLTKVMVPMAKSSIITIIILKLLGTWNAYVWPNLVAGTKYKLITTWLRTGFVDEASGGGRVLLNMQMTAVIVVTVPLLIMFIVFRKYIMSGVSRSGIKG